MSLSCLPMASVSMTNRSGSIKRRKSSATVPFPLDHRKPQTIAFQESTLNELPISPSLPFPSWKLPPAILGTVGDCHLRNPIVCTTFLMSHSSAIYRLEHRRQCTNSSTVHRFVHESTVTVLTIFSHSNLSPRAINNPPWASHSLI